MLSCISRSLRSFRLRPPFKFRAPAIPSTGFKSNFANFTEIKVDLKPPAEIQYLFSDNPKLTYTVRR